MLWYPVESKIISFFWGIVFYIRNIILLGSTTKETLLMWGWNHPLEFMGRPQICLVVRRQLEADGTRGLESHPALNLMRRLLPAYLQVSHVPCRYALVALASPSTIASCFYSPCNKFFSIHPKAPNSSSGL